MRHCELCGDEWDARVASGMIAENAALAAFGSALYELAEACPRCGCLREASAELLASSERAA